MAGTYYKYAEREADSQVNWFQVGKDLTDMIQKESETREAKKAAIDEASRKFGQELENAPQGNSDLVNKWTTNYAADMQEYRLMTLRLLKQGQLKPKDYTLINQNTIDGTKNLFNLSKEYQQEFDIKTERRKTDKSSAAETQFMAMVEGFANLGNTKPLIDPPTGAISIGKMEKGPDGVMRLKEGPDNYMTVNQLRQRIKTQVDKYQLNDELEAETKLLGEVVKEVVTKTGSSTQTGFMTKVTDPTKRKGLSQDGQEAVDTYIKTENQIVEAKLSNPQNISSILFDWTGGIDPKTNKPYQVVLDPEVAKTSSNYILWTYKDGIFQPDFESTENGKLQKEEAATYVKNKFRSMLEQKTEITPFSQPRKEYAPQYIIDRGDAAKTQEIGGNMISMLYSGTPDQQQAAINYFGGLPNVRSVTRDDSGVTVTTNDGVSKKISFKNENTGAMMNHNDFVRSASSLLLGGNVDINEVLKGALKTGSTNFQSGKASATSESTNPNEQYANYVSTSIKGVTTDEADTETALSPILSKIGFTIEQARPGKDYVVIKNKDGVASSEISLADPEIAAEDIRSFLLGNVPGTTEEQKLIYLNSLQKRGIFKSSSSKTNKKIDTSGY